MNSSANFPGAHFPVVFLCLFSFLLALPQLSLPVNSQRAITPSRPSQNQHRLVPIHVLTHALSHVYAVSFDANLKTYKRSVNILSHRHCTKSLVLLIWIPTSRQYTNWNKHTVSTGKFKSYTLLNPISSLNFNLLPLLLPHFLCLHFLRIYPKAFRRNGITSQL